MTIASEQLWETFSVPLQQFIRRRASDPQAKSRVQRARAKIKEQLLVCCHFQFDYAGRIVDYQPRCACCASSSCDIPATIRAAC